MNQRGPSASIVNSKVWRKYRSFFFFAMIAITTILFSCSQSTIDFSHEADGPILFKNANIQLQFDSNMYCKILYHKGKELLSLNSGEPGDPLSLPSHFIKTDTVIKDFQVDYDRITCREIKTAMGKGKVLRITGTAVDRYGNAIEKVLTIELYENFPDVAITLAQYVNRSISGNVELTDLYSNCYRLDASQVDASLGPHEMHTFYGTNGRPSPQIDGIIPDDFNRENYTGRSEDLEGIKRGNGGIPVVDVWCKKMGMAVGHIEPLWKNLYLPIQVQKDGRVKIAVREIPGLNRTKPYVLAPGDTITSVRSFVSVHSLDFFNTMARYAEMMKRQVLDFHSAYTEDDYLAGWCTWNSYCTTAMQSKYDVMMLEPVLQRVRELPPYGIRQVIFDAGWFDNQGDWKPNPEPRSFPNGEEDLKRAIREIHDQGCKVMLWISYLTADEWSDVARAHPEWMIQKPTGENHLDRWSGFTMCPSLPEVQEYYAGLARRLVQEYGADGFKVDGMYTCPPCYNPAHGHADPNESCEDYYKVFEAFYTNAKSINPKTTVMVCPCGTVCSYATLPYISQTIAADPPDVLTVRRFAKLYRALKGANSPYSSDYTDKRRSSLRLPTAIGCGTVPQTFFGKTPDEETADLYKKWFAIYNREKISRGEYLNEYDLYYDIPETHVIKNATEEGMIYYYSFYADGTEWSGEVELRGLPEDTRFRIVDYVNDRELGFLSGHSAKIDISFKDYLLIKCIPR